MIYLCTEINDNMKKNRIKLTNDMLKVISSIKVRESDYNEGISHYIAGIDANSVYGGSDLLEDISMAIGCYDKRIVGSEDDSRGIIFEDTDLENKMYDMHEYIMKNLINIENLLHYWSNKGGLTEGTYNTITLQKEE